MMRTLLPITILTLLLPALVACAAFNPIEHFRSPEMGGIKQAAFELGCQESELQVTELSVNTVGVSGCGKKAVYKLVTGAGWVNNTGGDDAKTTPKQ